MATRMTDTDRPVATVERKHRIWPWILLALAVAIGLWWASSNNRTANDTMNQGTTPYGMSPGTGTTGSAPGGIGSPGTGDVGGVGTPSPSPTLPAGPGAP
jgi:hypothetical protein